jgi:hypothetical protein
VEEILTEKIEGATDEETAGLENDEEATEMETDEEVVTEIEIIIEEETEEAAEEVVEAPEVKRNQQKLKRNSTQKWMII